MVYKSYLTNKNFCVAIDGHLSTPDCGVPQDFILGQLIFLIYVIDMPQALVNCEPFLYADDSCSNINISRKSKNILTQILVTYVTGLLITNSAYALVKIKPNLFFLPQPHFDYAITAW